MKRRSLVALILGLLLLLGACSSASGETSSSTTPTTPAITPGARNATGQPIAITAGGFTPDWPIVPLNDRVTFTNQTATDQQIIFDNARDASGANVASPVIPPDGTWVFTADTFTSLAYHSPNLPGALGRIQVDPPAEP